MVTSPDVDTLNLWGSPPAETTVNVLVALVSVETVAAAALPCGGDASEEPLLAAETATPDVEAVDADAVEAGCADAAAALEGADDTVDAVVDDVVAGTA